MANVKLSQIAVSPANAVAADQFVMVHGGNTDYLMSATSLAPIMGTLIGVSVAVGKSLVVNNSLVFSGTDGSTVAFGTGGNVAYGSPIYSNTLTVGTTPVVSGHNLNIEYNNGGTLGEYTITGSGTVVAMQTSPTFITPTLGVANATSYNGLVVTNTTGTLTISNGKQASVTNTLVFSGTDGSTVAFGAGGTVAYGSPLYGTTLTVGTTPVASGHNLNIEYNNAGTLGEYTITGSGTVVAMANSPTFTTPTLGAATATSLNSITFTAPANAATLTLANNKALTVSNTLTFTATDGSTVAFGAGGTVAYGAPIYGTTLVVGTTAITSGHNLNIEYNNAGVVGEYTITGSGTVVAMATSPTFTTPTLGQASATSIIIGAGSSLTSSGGGGTVAVLGATSQVFSGGLHITSDNLGTASSGTTTIDCGNGPQQYIVNNGAFTLAAPSNDGNCILYALNGASAGAIVFSGFTVGSNTGDSLTTTNTSKFFISIIRINGVSTYVVKALQ